MKYLAVVVLLSVVALSSAKVYFTEDFNSADWQSNWVISKNKASELGEWVHTAGDLHKDANNKGIQTGTDYRFYQISRAFDSFSNKGESLVFQFSVKHEQRLDCGGAYVKLLPSGFDQENFSGDTPYYIMFGPDVCGGTRRVHVIFNYKGTNHLIKGTIPPETDNYTHVYTLIVNPDQTYQVLIDNKEKKSGNLLLDWDFLPPKQINDPAQSKPADWVDEKEIVDPSAVKPAGWDDIPKLIRDPDATQPDDWDSDLDGDWEAPFVPNPEYQGEWVAPKIPNPAYKGPWVHPQIDNPDYVEDNNIYSYSDIAGVGIEIWQVKSGSIFDNILVTNSVEDAAAAAEEILAQQQAEKDLQQARDAAELAEKEDERRRLEEELDLEEEFDGHDHEEL